jgi:tannase/feruloyl esterase
MQLTDRYDHSRSVSLAAPLAPVGLVEGVTSRNRRVISTFAVMLLATFALPLASAPAAAQSCEKIALLKLPDTTITSATRVAAGPFAMPGARPPDGSPQGPHGPPVLPPFCRVAITVLPAIKIEVWLPTSGWNGNFQAVGNGGRAGSISYAAMVTALKLGYATASTDTGHEGGGADSSWAIGHPELVVDFGYRAIHEMTVAAKKVIETFYGTGPRLSYFNGCSTGGRQGLMEAQRFPDDYNGIVAGDPVNFYTHFLAGEGLWVALATLKDPESYIPVGKLPAIDDASNAACDRLDGVKDGLIEDPRKCKFDPSVLLCKGSDSSTCLTAKQVETAKKIYGGSHYGNGKEIFPGTMPGHERGWTAFITGTGPSEATFALSVGFLKYFVFEDPSWNFHTWNYERDLAFADKKVSSIFNATDPNLAPFRARGGKLILYHGWTDPGVSPLNTINYYKSVVASVTGRKSDAFEHETEPFSLSVNQTGEFIRLFMVPGMDHCGGGPGPNNFDALGSLADWAEHKHAPDRIIASHMTNDAVDRTRPLCPYPMTAQYTGEGSTDDAANFVCKLPSGR